MRIEFTSQPAREPVLLATVKDALNISFSDKDAFIGTLIAGARAAVENHTGLCLITRGANIYLDAWPVENKGSWWSGTREGLVSDVVGLSGELAFSVRPIQSITSIVTIATDGTETIWDTSNYYLQPGVDARLHPNVGSSWPTPGRVADGVRISASVGFGSDWNQVPSDLRAAITKIVAHMYEHRGDDGGAALIDSGAASLLNPYRTKRI